ncbi:hypothetical protein B0J18DRAFT_182116 [Chaetomium sp. MPI-SDFR-AT-0129]|nr:hypothetical protein B0J18DRAFT_182116 [Chaetomium sp. MPI-SDFR-AT-0129]
MKEGKEDILARLPVSLMSHELQPFCRPETRLSSELLLMVRRARGNDMNCRAALAGVRVGVLREGLLRDHLKLGVIDFPRSSDARLPSFLFPISLLAGGYGVWGLISYNMPLFRRAEIIPGCGSVRTAFAAASSRLTTSAAGTCGLLGRVCDQVRSGRMTRQYRLLG